MTIPIGMSQSGCTFRSGGSLRTSMAYTTPSAPSNSKWLITSGQNSCSSKLWMINTVQDGGVVPLSAEVTLEGRRVQKGSPGDTRGSNGCVGCGAWGGGARRPGRNYIKHIDPERVSRGQRTSAGGHGRLRSIVGGGRLADCRAHAVDSPARARRQLHRRDSKADCPTAAAGAAGRARVDDVPRDDGRIGATHPAEAKLERARLVAQLERSFQLDKPRLLQGTYQLAQLAQTRLELTERAVELAERTQRIGREVETLDAARSQGPDPAKNHLSDDVLVLRREHDRSEAEKVGAQGEIQALGRSLADIDGAVAHYDELLATLRAAAPQLRAGGVSGRAPRRSAPGRAGSTRRPAGCTGSHRTLRRTRRDRHRALSASRASGRAG